MQPADGEWTISGPFEAKKILLEGYGEVFTGRGSVDCKGQQYLALSALAALHEVLDGGLASLPIRVIVCVEGEEEIGSPGFPYFLKEYGKELFSGAEFVLSSDGDQPLQDQVSFTILLLCSVCVSMRGSLYYSFSYGVI